MARKVADWKPLALAADTVGGILLAREASNRLGIPLLIGRQSGKTIDWVNPGEVGQGVTDRIVLIDDILTTGGTLASALQSLRAIGAVVAGVGVAVDRSGGEGEILLEGVRYEVSSLVQLALNKWDPSDCPLCPKSCVDLYNPEEDFLSVVLSMPPGMTDTIIAQYREVYGLQRDHEQVELIDQWRPWLPVLLEGLPVTTVAQDSALTQFIRRFVHRGEADPRKRRVLTELVGHLLATTHIRVERRSVGCSVLISDRKTVSTVLPLDAPVRTQSRIGASNLGDLVPYYDALPETEAAFLFDKDGELIGIRRLVRSMDSGEVRGIEVLRQITGQFDAIGLVLRRNRKALSVYREGRLEAIAELSQRTGAWEFTTPKPIVGEIEGMISGIGQTLETVLEIAQEMVTRGYGGLFVVGDIPSSLQRKPPKIKVIEQPLVLLGTRMAAEIAKLDGAVFISGDGEVQDASVIIRNTVKGEATSDMLGTAYYSSAGGSRKETAYRTSKECR
ncbi:MAG TPA: phosphoribosyltransferase, partial [Dehalococcoidia bacterium]|nr:phosphoribosyltransferase [Dehalococcoidia bacterium]